MRRLFESHGVHVLVDGQYGSTGKGVLAAWLASQPDQPEWAGVISNAGPNSGHTFYHNGEKHVLKQLPTFAVAKYLMGETIPVYLSAGAIIDPEILAAEMLRYPGIPVLVHPCAAVITMEDKRIEMGGTIAAVAGTRSGTGAVAARKVARDPMATIWGSLPHSIARKIEFNSKPLDVENYPFFMEVSQGFSLGLNDARFYPKVTSRECTVMQAIADARVSYKHVAKTYMSLRTYPIRVGNVDGHSSGEWYPDQEETTWEELEQVAERTTVTNRVRRVATFSRMQFDDAFRANTPDFVFINFMNYVALNKRFDFLGFLKDYGPYHSLIAGYGPTSEDVEWVRR